MLLYSLYIRVHSSVYYLYSNDNKMVNFEKVKQSSDYVSCLNFIKENGSLANLQFENVDDLKAWIISSSLISNNTLKTLSLIGDFGQNGAFSIANMLKMNNILETFVYHRNQTDSLWMEGLYALDDGLKSNTSLKCFALENCKIG